MHHLKQASNIRRSGCLAGASGGAHSQSQEFVNASQTGRKAAYPNSYAASEGALVDQDGARNAELEGMVLARAQSAELDGDALARAIDNEVEEVVAASPVVLPLLVAADAQSQAIRSLQAVHDSFRESLSSSASGDLSLQPSDASSTDTSAPSAPHSPEVSKRLQELQAQIEDLERQRVATNAKLREAEATARQQARAQMAASLQSVPTSALPKGSLKRWLQAVPRHDHLAALQRETAYQRLMLDVVGNKATTLNLRQCLQSNMTFEALAIFQFTPTNGAQPF